MAKTSDSEFEQVESHWDRLSSDPMWAVLSDPTRRGSWNSEDFWRTGEADVRQVLSEVEQCGLRINFEAALDFGCGLGRLSRVLANHFKRVDGVDIASRMIDLARAQTPKVYFHHNAQTDLSLFESERFDFALSLMTFQHMPPRFMRGYLAELARVLRPGGVAYVQIPVRPRVRFSWTRVKTKVRRTLFRLEAAKLVWRLVRGQLPMEMYALEPKEVRRVCVAARLQIVAELPDEAAGADWVSSHYIMRRVE